MQEDQISDQDEAAKILAKKLVMEMDPSMAGKVDWEIFEIWVAEHPEVQRIYNQLRSPDELVELVAMYQASVDSKDEALARFISTIDPVRQIKQSKLQRIYYLSGIAASIIILLTCGIVLFRGRHAEKPGLVMSAPKAADKLPAVNGAILELADGSKIEVDSSASGIISRQGSSSVNKTEGGLLAYGPSGNERKKTIYNTLTTGKGQRFRLILPDGTKVWLNAGSRIKYFAQLGENEENRSVDLQGEAYFEIAPNSSVPFKVYANHTQTTVLGTHFNVSAYDEESFVAITLFQGSVRVGYGRKSLVVRPGQQAVAHPGSEDLVSAVDDDLDRASAWRDGVFQFHSTLPEIARELSRWYNVDIRLEGHFSDVITARESREVPLGIVLQKLEEIHAGHFKIEGDKITATP